ncbi:MAG: DUF481 domain-containing protein [Candidatus Omnitrophica bacterium]|nr:DUF481 domain-containing protein [Candidatus Omnitrophota bacterium]
MRFILILIFFLFAAQLSPAREVKVFLENGDVVSGTFVEKTEEHLVIETEAIGEIKILAAKIVSIDGLDEGTLKAQNDEKDKKNEVAWKQKATVGYTATQGNTKNQYMRGGFIIDRSHIKVNEMTLRGNVSYSSTDKVMDVQTWQSSGRYAWNFGGRKDWYHFLKAEISHDRFSNIYYRTIPSTGIGWWLFDRDNTKFMLEGAIGLERTDYYGAEKTSDELIAVPRLYFEQKIIDRISFSQNLYYYPYIKNFDIYRLSSTSKISNKVTENISIDISIIDEYNSSPPVDTKSNDLKFITSLTYDL